jgi:hypothetical protein
MLGAESQCTPSSGELNNLFRIARIKSQELVKSKGFSPPFVRGARIVQQKFSVGHYELRHLQDGLFTFHSYSDLIAGYPEKTSSK